MHFCRGVKTHPPGQRFVGCKISDIGKSSILDRGGVTEFSCMSVQLKPFIDSPDVRKRMRNERIIDSVAGGVFLPERYVHPAGSKVELMVGAPKLREIFHIQV